MTLAELQKILGKKNGKALFDFFHKGAFQGSVDK
jgi:hypothetical protein